MSELPFILVLHSPDDFRPSPSSWAISSKTETTRRVLDVERRYRHDAGIHASRDHDEHRYRERPDGASTLRAGDWHRP